MAKAPHWLKIEKIKNGPAGFAKFKVSGTPHIQVHLDRTHVKKGPSDAEFNWLIDCPIRDAHGNFLCISPQDGVNWETGWNSWETAMRVADRHRRMHQQQLSDQLRAMSSVDRADEGEEIISITREKLEELLWRVALNPKVDELGRPEPDPKLVVQWTGSDPERFPIHDARNDRSNWENADYITPDGQVWKIGTVTWVGKHGRLRVQLRHVDGY